MQPFRTLSLVLVAALGVGPMLPGEHVHETEVNGQSHVVVHQHLQLHGIDHPLGGPGGRGVFDHPDDPILTLSTVFIVPAQHAVAVPDLPLVATIQTGESDDGAAFVELTEWPIHGPPRQLPLLRGPPPPVL